MSWSKPAVSQVHKAIEAYLRIAYGGRAAPSAINARLETLRACSDDEFWECAVFERDNPSRPTRYSLRLGNPTYPHMKLVIERSPDGKTFLFRADTHDRHIAPKPDSREHRLFAELMKQNQLLAEQIELEWSRFGVPTFKQYLRQDLERRAGAASPGAAPPPIS